MVFSALHPCVILQLFYDYYRVEENKWSQILEGEGANLNWMGGFNRSGPEINGIFPLLIVRFNFTSMVLQIRQFKLLFFRFKIV